MLVLKYVNLLDVRQTGLRWYEVFEEEHLIDMLTYGYAQAKLKRVT